MRLICIFAVGIAVAGLSAQAQTEIVNAIAVIVDDGVITFKDVQTLVSPGIELLQRQYEGQPAVYRQKVMDAQRDGIEQLVEQQLILRDFKSAGYAFPESIIDEYVKDRVREQFGDQLKMTQTLHAQGMTKETFRRQMRDNLIVRALTEKNISAEILISPYKIEQFYANNREQYKMEDQVKLRRIDINQSSGSAAGHAKKLADEILHKLEEGASFKEMAAIYSEGSQRADEGDWGWQERSKMAKELADVAFALKPGTRSGVIETPNYCYIILVEETKPAHFQNLSEVRDEIEKTLLTQERKRLHKKYIDRLKNKSFVRYF